MELGTRVGVDFERLFSNCSLCILPGGMMSVFLMGVYDVSSDKFCTVCKCGNGHDDTTIQRLQTELDMVKISKDRNKVPSWLMVHRSQIPDFVVTDPKVSECVCVCVCVCGWVGGWVCLASFLYVHTYYCKPFL